MPASAKVTGSIINLEYAILELKLSSTAAVLYRAIHYNGDGWHSLLALPGGTFHWRWQCVSQQHKLPSFLL